MQMMAFLPMSFSASPSPTVVVVLPSPAGVGVMAVTRISLPSGLPFERGDVVERDLGLVMPVRDQVLGADAELVLRHFEDRPHLGGLADLDIGFRILVLLVRTLARFFGSFTRLN